MARSKGLAEWLWPAERRRAKRKSTLPLEAYYWDGAEPQPRRVKNVSPEGMYLLTEQRWYRNTLLQMTLVRRDRAEGQSDRSIRITARVIRSGIDGAGFAFAFRPTGSKQSGDIYESDATREMLEKFLDSMERESARRKFVNAFVPAALTMPFSNELLGY